MQPSGRGPLATIRASAGVFVTLAGVSCAITLVFLGMRGVMDIGGACASGGPYVPRVECPDGVAGLMTAGIWGGLIFLGLYLWQTSKHGVPGLAALAWPALFLSLGWNFLEYGIDPPVGDGPVWAWVVCAVVFALMGGLPLPLLARPLLRQFSKDSERTPAPFVVPTRSNVRAAIAQQRGSASAEDVGVPADEHQPGSVVASLERLAALHRAGSLDDREFEAAKKRVLGEES